MAASFGYRSGQALAAMTYGKMQKKNSQRMLGVL
jgi:hypothetical protein